MRMGGPGQSRHRRDCTIRRRSLSNSWSKSTFRSLPREGDSNFIHAIADLFHRGMACVLPFPNLDPADAAARPPGPPLLPAFYRSSLSQSIFSCHPGLLIGHSLRGNLHSESQDSDSLRLLGFLPLTPPGNGSILGNKASICLELAFPKSSLSS
jgi:hypothetical protein